MEEDVEEEEVEVAAAEVAAEAAAVTDMEEEGEENQTIQTGGSGL